MNETEKQVIELLKNHTSNKKKDKNGLYKYFATYVRGLNKKELSHAIMACATFRLYHESIIIFSECKIETAYAKHKVKISNIYLEFAQALYNCI